MAKNKDALFRFKQFNVRHDRSCMKVGTDAVLLGAWVELAGAERILEIGTGSGVIALMLAQRTQAETKIDAVEIDKASCLQATDNFLHSPWPDKIRPFCQSIQAFPVGKLYDLIISNPPYFQSSMLPPSDKRKMSRHTESLSHDDLLFQTKRLLSQIGRLAVILPAAEGILFIEKAAKYHFFCQRLTSFKARADKPVERFLLEFGFESIKRIETEIIHYAEGETWTEEYAQLTKAFYLKGAESIHHKII